MNNFSTKMAGEVHFLSFDFTEFLAPDEKITFASVDARVAKGRDPEYKSFTYGNVVVEGALVSQRVSGGKPDVTYKLTATVETSKRQVLKVAGNISVISDVEVDDADFNSVDVKSVGDDVEEVEDISEPSETAEPVLEKEVKQIKKFHFETTEVKEIEVNGSAYGRIAGYAATYDVDRVDDRIVPGAFSKTISNFKTAGRPVRMYYQHDDKEIIGAFIPQTMREDERGLYVEGDINLEVQRGREVYALAKQGVLTDMSIGYSVKDFDIKDGIRELKEIELWEISVVSEPANPKAKITAVKSINELKDIITKKSDLEKVLREAGFSRASAKWIAGLIDLKKLKEEDVMTKDNAVELREEVKLIADEPTPTDADNQETSDELQAPEDSLEVEAAQEDSVSEKSLDLESPLESPVDESMAELLKVLKELIHDLR